MERDPEIDGAWERQDEIEPVGWIQDGGLGPAQIRHTAVDVRIPEGQMPVPELVGRKRPPVDELRGEIVSAVRQHDGPAREQDVAKHAEGQPQQEGNSDPTGTD